MCPTGVEMVYREYLCEETRVDHPGVQIEGEDDA